jgi:DNA-directed RNA polymerase subunit RPC12/RpoP
MKSRSSLWEQLLRVLNRWLQDAGAATLLVTLEGDRPEIHLAAHTPFAFPILALQLLLFVMGAQREAACSNCGRVYLPTREPQKDRNHYCPACGRRAANRAAIRRFRERQIEKKRHTAQTKKAPGGMK